MPNAPRGIEVGLRVLIGHRQACRLLLGHPAGDVFARWPNAHVAMAREAPRGPDHRPCRPPPCSRPDAMPAMLDLSDPSPEPAPAELEDEALRAEAAARAVKGRFQGPVASAALWPSTHPSRRDQRVRRGLRAHRPVALGGGDHRRGHGHGSATGTPTRASTARTF